MKVILVSISMMFVLSLVNAQTGGYAINIDSLLEHSSPDSAMILFDFNTKRAELDVKNNAAVLLLPGTMGCPQISKADFKFQTKYAIRYSCPGCSSFGFQDLEGYNKLVFQHLTELYGTDWIGDIRNDVIGIKDYR